MVDRVASKRRRIMRDFIIKEVSAVDHPAQGHARAVIMKRAGPQGPTGTPGGVKKDVVGAYPLVSSLQEVERDIEAMDFDEVLAAEQSREAAMRVKDCVWSCWNALQRSFDSISDDDSLAPDAKVSAMRESLAQFLDAVRAESATVADTIEKSISAAPALAELLDATGSEGGSPMTDAEKRQLEELQKSVADLTAKLEAATAKADEADDKKDENDKKKDEELEKVRAQLAEALAKAEMSDDEKEYLEDKDEDAKKAFMSMSPEARKNAMKKAADADPVVYKSESTGEEFRKSDDPRLVKMAKAADEDRKIAKEEREKRETSELSKRADDELKVFSDDIAKRDDKIEVLRAIDKMEDGPRVAVLKMLEVGGKAISAAFETIGHKRGDVAKSGADFEKCVTTIMQRDKCTKLAALDKAAREYPDEFAAYQATGAQLSN